MKKAELKAALEQYRALSMQAAELEKQKAAIADRIKAHMEGAGLDEVQVGDTVCRYREVTSSRFDNKAFAASHSRLYAMFCKPQTVRRFTVA